MTDVLEQEIAQAPDCVLADDYERTVRILIDLCVGTVWSIKDGWWVATPKQEIPGVLGQQWLNRAAQHVAQKLDRSFRDGPKINTEQHAMAYIKSYAPHFLDASQSLLKAAETFKAMGKALAANEAYLAYKRAAAKAQELNP
jgi:hypothetical protein